MTRYFRTVYATTLACMLLSLITPLVTGVHMPFSPFSCLLLGLLLFLLPNVLPKLSGRETLFALLGTAAALLGFLPILLSRCPAFHYIAYALFVLAAALFLITLRHNTTYNNFKARFGFITVVVLCLLFYFILSATTMRRISGTVHGSPVIDPERLKIALNDLIPFAIVLLASGILCLRGLRAQCGDADERSFRRRQLRDALIFLFSVSAVFITVPLLKPVWTLFVQYVLAPLGRMLYDLVESAATGNPQTNTNPFGYAAQQTIPPGDGKPVGTPAPAASAAPIESAPPAAIRSGEYIKTVVALLVLAAVIAVAAIILKKALRRLKKSDRSYPNESVEALPETDEPKKDSKPHKHSSDPRRRMRYLYAAFLRNLRRISYQRGGGPSNGGAEPENIDPGSWGETANSGYSWSRERMSSLPEHSASMSYLQTRDEGISNERASVLMRLFDRKSSRRRGLAARKNAERRQIFRTSTCREIEERAERLSCADASDLSAFTSYYERARYRLAADPTDEDAARMAELYDRIRKAE